VLLSGKQSDKENQRPALGASPTTPLQTSAVPEVTAIPFALAQPLDPARAVTPTAGERQELHKSARKEKDAETQMSANVLDRQGTALRGTTPGFVVFLF